MAKQFPYDAACKALFGEEIIFRNLLANYGILPSRDVGAITAVRLLSPNLETEKASRRMADLIWAVTFPQGEVHVLLEFQRGRDETMANRMAVYAHLHMAKLLEQKKPPGQLPAILPIVIYLGEKPWNCARHSHELYAPAPARLPVPLPNCSYHLLDVHRLPREQLDRAGAEAFFFRMLRADSTDDIYAAACRIVEKLQGAAEYGRLLRIVRNLFYYYTGADDWHYDFSIPATDEEMQTMLAKFRRAEEKKLQAVEARSRAEGRAEGEARGRAEGEARGRAEGEARGRAEGRRETLLELLNIRFGSVKADWLEIISSMRKEASFQRLIPAVYEASSIEQFAKLLSQTWAIERGEA